MAFNIENGSGVKNANSYASVEEFTAYWLERGVLHTLTDVQVQALLVLATEYIDVRWKFKGIRQFDSLKPRGVLTLTGNPSDGESIVVGLNTYVMRTTPTANNEIEIDSTLLQTAFNIAAATDSFMADLDLPIVTIYLPHDGLTTSTDMVAGSFSNDFSQGYSAKKQPLEFPRLGLLDKEGDAILGIPANLKAACIEYAWRANVASLMPDLSVDASGNMVKSRRQKVGPIEEEYEYSEARSTQLIRPYPFADGLIKDFTLGTGALVRN